MAKRSEQAFNLDSTAVANKVRELLGDTVSGWLASADTVDPETEKKKEQLKTLLEGEALETALASLPDSEDKIDEAKEAIANGIVSFCNELKLPVSFKDAAEQQSKINQVGRSVITALRGAGVDLDHLGVSAGNEVRMTTSSKPAATRAKRGSKPKEPTLEATAAVKKVLSNGQAWKSREINAALPDVDKAMLTLVLSDLKDKSQVRVDGQKAGTTYSKAWK